MITAMGIMAVTAINLGNATNATVNNYKAFGLNKWGDGIDCFAC